MPNGMVHSGCTDPTQVQHVNVLVNRIQKSGTRDNNFVRWRGTFSLTDQNDQTGQSRLPSKPVTNIPVRPNRNGPFHLFKPTETSRILGWMEIKHPWTSLSGRYWSLPLGYIQLIYPTTFSCFCWNFVTLLTNLTIGQAQKQLKTKILVEFKPG